MKKYYKERFELQRRVARGIATAVEVNEILEKLREEARKMVPTSMEACVLLLDPEAYKYTRPLQCALYDRPVNCLSCKKNRMAVQKALKRKKGVVISKTEPIIREDDTLVETGPEAAIPIFVDKDILGAVHLVSKPGTRFTKRDFYMIKDLSEIAGNAILKAKRHWAVTQEKIKISQMLAHLSPFVPLSVKNIIEKSPDMLLKEKQEREVTVLFLDLEGYTKLSASKSEYEVNELIEKTFSSFVDPIHRSGGDINETAGDGLMIIFKDEDEETNAVNAVKAALDIYNINKKNNMEINRKYGPLTVNMGINSGSALLGMSMFKGAIHTRMTYTASGQVTNMAARLADYAHGGDILIGASTKSMIEGLWPIFDRGEVLLKGFDQPVKIFSLKKGEKLAEL